MRIGNSCEMMVNFLESAILEIRYLVISDLVGLSINRIELFQYIQAALIKKSDWCSLILALCCGVQTAML